MTRMIESCLALELWQIVQVIVGWDFFLAPSERVQRGCILELFRLAFSFVIASLARVRKVCFVIAGNDTERFAGRVSSLGNVNWSKCACALDRQLFQKRNCRLCLLHKWT